MHVGYLSWVFPLLSWILNIPWKQGMTRDISFTQNETIRNLTKQQWQKGNSSSIWLLWFQSVHHCSSTKQQERMKYSLSFTRTCFLNSEITPVMSNQNHQYNAIWLTQIIGRSCLHVLIMLYMNHNVEVSVHMICGAGSFWTHNISQSSKGLWKEKGY